jgi:glycerol kinase
MSDDLILAIDQGTTNTKAIVVNTEGGVEATASVRVPLSFPLPGWVETDPDALWQTVEAAIAQCLSTVDRRSIVAVGLTNQRESVLVWDRRTGRPLGPCISWQCRRTAPFCDQLRDQGREDWLRARTGLGIDPLFSASKARWLLDRVVDSQTRARVGGLCIGTVDSWILWNLTGGAVFATDLTNASRTQLLDLDRVCWDEELVSLFDIPMEALPELGGSSQLFGRASGSGPIPTGVPIAGVVGDSHGALFGHGAPAIGAVKATYGTGTSVMAPVDGPLRTSRLSTTIGWSLGVSENQAARSVVYALEGNITATGAALEWVATIMGMAGRESELERLAVSVPDSGEAYLVPAFAGLGAPHWDPGARGLVTGLTRGTTQAHLARAAFESIAYQVRDVVDVLRSTAPTPPTAILADGGAMRSDLLAQIQADVLRVPVLRTHSENLAALGAAYLAGLAVGVWGSLDEIRTLRRDFDRFEPCDNADAAEAGYRGWKIALRRADSQLDRKPQSIHATET